MFPLAASALFLVAGCDKPQKELSERLDEAERRAAEATARQVELERQIEQQRLAAEMDAIERERMEIETARIALEQSQGDAATEEAERLKRREEEIARRESEAAAREAELNQRASDINQQGAGLSERERELAGREALTSQSVPREPAAPVADYGMFYDSLSSYGSWFETPDYGYVWQPVVVRQHVGWRPYTRGRWVCTDYGWTWISHEPFGWATYHYGRWALLHGVGWVWVPGSVWAPAWVTWRSGGDFIGWAPLPPETMAWRHRDWDSSVEVSFGIGSSWFSFVEYRHFSDPIQSHCLPYQRNTTYVQQTTNITHIHIHQGRVVNGGPKYDELSRRAGKKLPFYRLDLNHRGRPGRDSTAMRHRFDGDSLHIAAPAVDAEWNAALRPARVERRLESVRVERGKEPQAEIVDRFRENRRQSRERAERAIAEAGGNEKFGRKRFQILQANRRDANAEAAETGSKLPRPAQGPAEEPDGGLAIDANQDRNNRVRDENPAAIGAGQTDSLIDQTDSIRRSQEAQEQRRQAQAMEQARREDRENRRAQIDEARRQQEASEQQSRQQEEANRREQIEEARRQQEATEQQARQQEEANRREQIEEARRQQEATEQQARQQEEENRRAQIEEARRQQEATEQQARQQEEENRRAQIEEARRQQETAEEQARQQEEANRRAQIEEARRQQEEARRMQMEEARRQQEEARRMQMEEARRQQEEARRMQMEESRRQQEESRRMQMEESRRQQEEARRMQMEEVRQQQEESRRMQMEESRRQQQEAIEQSRRQQEDTRRNNFE
jgi:hypothetical protein